MLRRTLAKGAIAFTAAGLTGARPVVAQQAPVEIQFWHGLTQPLGGMLEQIATDFNASQPRYRINATYRGGYGETMVAAIAAFRANSAPNIVQMFEVGTATMMAATRATKPVWELLQQTGVNIDFNDVLAGVRGYYSLPDGRMASMPFNSSTSVAFYNKDAFRRAGLDAEKFPATWPGVAEAARKLKAAGIASPMTTSWPTWLMIEQFSAIHDIPLATKGNGFGGLDAELAIDNPLMVRHMQNLIDWQKEGLFRYGGRDNAADGLFPAGECAITFASSGVRARILKEARFDWGTAMLPYYDDVPKAPLNSIIGGASLWAMNKGASTGRSEAEWKGVAEFFAWLAKPDVAAKWHTDTGYLPLTRSGYERVKATGFYQQNVGADIPIEQMLRGGGTLTENSRGIRLGGFAEIRNIIQEEMEKAFQGQQDAKTLLQGATRRGNVVLRNFERANRSG
jgi:sn-glycerol 3-phosphate transport system substrate-binding protein